MNASFTCQRQDVHPPNECNTLIPDNDVHDECAPPEPPTCPTDHLQPASSLRPDRHPADPDAARLTDPFGQFQYPTSPLGHAASGFLDEIAFEEFLLRSEQLHDDHQRLARGEHLSGPAADLYRQRIAAASQFRGLTITTAAQANTALANPDLQVHHGALLTCIWRPETAACQDHTTADERTGPTWPRCRLSCTNITELTHEAHADNVITLHTGRSRRT